LPSVGTFKLSGVAVSANQVIPVGDLPNLVFRPPNNSSGMPLASFTFEVQDAGGTDDGGVDTDPWANTFNFNVTSINDAPVGANNVRSTPENTPYVFVAGDFGFTDPNDDPANSFLAVKITSLPAAGTLLLNGTAVSANDYIDVDDIGSGLLTFAPAANA